MATLLIERPYLAEASNRFWERAWLQEIARHGYMPEHRGEGVKCSEAWVVHTMARVQHNERWGHHRAEVVVAPGSCGGARKLWWCQDFSNASLSGHVRASFVPI